MKPMRIAIIGAGTAGLSAANLLAKQSHHISIFEKAPALKPVGAGLLLQPSGLSVFSKLGVLDHACSLGAPVSGLVGKLPSGQKIVNSFYREAFPDGAAQHTFRQIGLGIHRASLCHVLVESLKDIPIRWHMGCDVTQVSQQGSQQNSQSVIHFTDATADSKKTQHSAAFDLVLVCNGAKSALRPVAWTLLDKPYPWGAIWAIVPECHTLDTQILHQFYDGASVMMGVLPTGSMPTTETWS